MGYVEAAVFGLIQGVTEFLPVSSSGHLAVLKELWGYEDISILFDIMLHIATLIAVVIVFRKRIGLILLSLFRAVQGKADEQDKMHLRLILLLLLATAITAVLGITIEKFLPMKGNIRVVGVLFIVTACILLLSARIKPGDKGYSELQFKDSLLLGVAQGLGVFAGISRSGITISTGIFTGLRREEAGELSFLLSIPAILGAALLKIGDLGSVSSSISVPALSVGFAVSFLSGLLALTGLMRLVRKGKLHFFSFYLIPLGLLCIFLL